MIKKEKYTDDSRNWMIKKKNINKKQQISTKKTPFQYLLHS
jgi:hypothetical protein